VLECKVSLEDLARKESLHQEMMKELAGEIRKLSEEKDRLAQEKARLAKAIEKICAISFEAKGL
jgi:hypothetical protein